jgi:5,5'-dehydrodivanillate O-demethylase
MLSQQANERLTRVGRGTPAGEFLRRYWQPIATLADLEPEPVVSVKVLGEQLALFRTDEGRLGLVAERCAHRGASLAYGIPEEDGLRCCYHGWKYDFQGHCIEQPAEPSDSTYKDRICIDAYPVQELGGLIWAYFGPAPVPLLPRYDLLVRDDLEREIGVTHLPCNWLQAMENSLDPVHLEYLHGKYTNYRMKLDGKPPAAKIRHHEKIRFEVFEYGISKFRLLEGDSEDSDEWRIGHPILFPNILAVGDNRSPEFQFRVPIDDGNTLVFWYWTRRRAAGAPLQDRTNEHLATSDSGVILFRKVLEEQLQRVERGEDPIAVVRDSDKNTPMIEIPRERQAFYTVGNFIDASEDAVPAAQRVP